MLKRLISPAYTSFLAYFMIAKTNDLNLSVTHLIIFSLFHITEPPVAEEGNSFFLLFYSNLIYIIYSVFNKHAVI